MTILDEAKKLRAEVLRLGSGTGRTYPVDLQQRILAWVDRAIAAGWRAVTCGEAVDVPQHRFHLWREYAQRPADWKPRRRASKPKKPVESTALTLVPVQVPATFSEGIVVTAPSGYRIEGLSFEQLVALLRGAS